MEPANARTSDVSTTVPRRRRRYLLLFGGVGVRARVHARIMHNRENAHGTRHRSAAAACVVVVAGSGDRSSTRAVDGGGSARTATHADMLRRNVDGRPLRSRGGRAANQAGSDRACECEHLETRANADGVSARGSTRNCLGRADGSLQDDVPDGVGGRIALGPELAELVVVEARDEGGDPRTVGDHIHGSPSFQRQPVQLRRRHDLFARSTIVHRGARWPNRR